MNRTARSSLLAATATAALVVGAAAPASAEVDYIAGYLLYTSNVYRGNVSDMHVDWGWGCSVEIGYGSSAQYDASVKDVRADGGSVTVWRKYAAYGFNSGWSRIGYDDTSTSGAGSIHRSESYCDTKGVWISTCFGADAPESTAGSSRCAVSYKQDNS